MSGNRLLDYVKLVVFLGVMALAAAWFANLSRLEITGSARIVDGDSLFVDGQEVRLFGIDAPEFLQNCQLGKTKGEPYACGKMAREFLKSLTEGHRITCVGRQVDRYDRLLAVCSANGVDLNRELVVGGWAVSFGDYEAAEEIAKQNAAGVWRGEFVEPAKWRQIDQEKHSSGWLGRIDMW